ncbi:MAG TPA: biotin/lipoyl-containing protein, partial [Candidatus Acidoferrum sp.]|nr:biotin/lipoyl-containing protein [Candidatus Acidoferrum sp.]
EQMRHGRSQPRKMESQAGKKSVSAPMPGKVVKLLVKLGDVVREGDGIVVVEAMKMENELKAPAAGTIAEIRTQEGKAVNGGDVLVVIR